ncbi:SDR family NAD(P)-dependent oxidoreductase [Phyllobacterium meliloti]|uniref:SDR family NAD(P)-dependent oxidoreductase n=1 Tax=Phyllobacterium meliloti TaxID=555317 RepID=UPI001D151BA4|nr:SDR family oxidoreductase [Phyllobacterium sp. T1293]UGX88237.1 SDR family oxidoreductase [Phyllobacterium sp. T1293]
MTNTSPVFARYPGLVDKPVFVSGGATGIGEMIVRAFAAEGAKVGFVDLAEAEGKTLAEELNTYGGKVTFRAVDITNISAYQKIIREIEEMQGAATVLINNAANDTRHDWREVTPDYFDQRIAVNLRHMFFAIQAVAPAMIKSGGGSIINFGSVGWMMASGGYPGYASAKSAVHGMTRSFARDLGKHGIRVNTLVPGWVMTRRQLDLWVDDAANELIDRSQCLAGRLLPEDIARMALFLASDDSKMCSAQNFIVDGGWV